MPFLVPNQQCYEGNPACLSFCARKIVGRKLG